MRASRKQSKKTQTAIADDLGVTQPLVSKWESGEAIPEPSDWRAVADAYDIPVKRFIAAAIASSERIAKKRAS